MHEDYDVMKQQLVGDDSKDFKACITRIRAREQELLASEAKEGLAKKVRRNKTWSSSTSGNGHDSWDNSQILELPKIMKATHRHFTEKVEISMES